MAGAHRIHHAAQAEQIAAGIDDVAASLDTVTEHHISRVLTGALGDRTRLIVAHRASTAARADAVIWLDGGRLRAMAPHAELWQEPEYRVLFEPAEPPAPAAPKPTAIADFSQASRFVQALKELGCKFALDDFGTAQAR